MDRERKIELVKRVLGLKHKLKVHESMKAPDSHDELAVMWLSKWEHEDEITAIEEILANARREAVTEKRKLIEKEGAPKKKTKK